MNVIISFHEVYIDLIMIPKIIHYCWFGRSALPDFALKCIESWKRFFPDYTIKEWNENNFDVNIIPYTQGAYEAGKYAFVSDYARFWILYHEGGVYFDTDVEVIKPMDEIIKRGSFMGIEKLNELLHDVEHASMVNPGLGMGCEAGDELIGEVLEHYKKLPWCQQNMGSFPETVVHHTTKVLSHHGFIHNNIEQRIKNMYVYPSDVLCPMDSSTGLLNITSRTVSIHHYTCSWVKKSNLRFNLHLLKKKLIRIFGERIILSLIKWFRRT